MPTNSEKPASLRYHECIDAVCAALNSANLPAFVLLDLMGNVLREVQRQADAEYQRDTQLYQQQLAEADKKHNNTDDHQEG